MEENVFYASDDRSSIELIEQDFCRSGERASRLRSGARHHIFNQSLVDAAWIVMIAVVVLGLLIIVFPDMR